jgi:hypothetical protein
MGEPERCLLAAAQADAPIRQLAAGEPVRELLIAPKKSPVPARETSDQSA